GACDRVRVKHAFGAPIIAPKVSAAIGLDPASSLTAGETPQCVHELDQYELCARGRRLDFEIEIIGRALGAVYQLRGGPHDIDVNRISGRRTALPFDIGCSNRQDIDGSYGLTKTWILARSGYGGGNRNSRLERPGRVPRHKRDRILESSKQ